MIWHTTVPCGSVRTEQGALHLHLLERDDLHHLLDDVVSLTIGRDFRIDAWLSV